MYYIDPTFNSDGDYERFFWKEELEDHNIEIDIVRIVLPKNYKHGNEYESKIMEDLGYKLISLFEEIYNYKATPEIQKLVDFKEFEKWYDIHRKRISAKATENAAKKAA